MEMGERVAMSRRQEANVCEFGHTAHKARHASTVDGEFVVWDWDTYADLDSGYCPGRDDTSRTLLLYGIWEPPDWRRFTSLIRRGDVVYDFGSHIGWYTRAALKRGASVYAVDADPEMMRLLHANTRPWHSDLTTETVWALEAHPPEAERIRILKADIEGAEIDAVDHFWPLIRRGAIDFIFLEASPEFDSYYPDLIDLIRSNGYSAETVDGEPLEGATLGDTQKNVWLISDRGRYDT